MAGEYDRVCGGVMGLDEGTTGMGARMGEGERADVGAGEWAAGGGAGAGGEGTRSKDESQDASFVLSDLVNLSNCRKSRVHQGESN